MEIDQPVPVETNVVPRKRKVATDGVSKRQKISMMTNEERNMYIQKMMNDLHQEGLSFDIEIEHAQQLYKLIQRLRSVTGGDLNIILTPDDGIMIYAAEGSTLTNGHIRITRQWIGAPDKYKVHKNVLLKVGIENLLSELGSIMKTKATTIILRGHDTSFNIIGVSTISSVPAIIHKSVVIKVWDIKKEMVPDFDIVLSNTMRFDYKLMKVLLNNMNNGTILKITYDLANGIISFHSTSESGAIQNDSFQFPATMSKIDPEGNIVAFSNDEKATFEKQVYHTNIKIFQKAFQADGSEGNSYISFCEDRIVVRNIIELGGENEEDTFICYHIPYRVTE